MENERLIELLLLDILTAELMELDEIRKTKK